MVPGSRFRHGLSLIIDQAEPRLSASSKTAAPLSTPDRSRTGIPLGEAAPDSCTSTTTFAPGVAAWTTHSIVFSAASNTEGGTPAQRIESVPRLLDTGDGVEIQAGQVLAVDLDLGAIARAGLRVACGRRRCALVIRTSH